jgi:hypothetical protein
MSQKVKQVQHTESDACRCGEIEDVEKIEHVPAMAPLNIVHRELLPANRRCCSNVLNGTAGSEEQIIFSARFCGCYTGMAVILCQYREAWRWRELPDFLTG